MGTRTRATDTARARPPHAPPRPLRVIVARVRRHQPPEPSPDRERLAPLREVTQRTASFGLYRAAAPHAVRVLAERRQALRPMRASVPKNEDGAPGQGASVPSIAGTSQCASASMMP
ncbi:hypothetical protein PsYK624_063830 [Phanerochaete sordida]|uniref:Uncharacterized protein n=1 Tax=Phanerochaete sordida TaxID=48140 RepID=A0A9P3G9F1_9APHY|nr:hypothetical protein PsYK624_063830 [Phanerochaete sordida]